MPRTRLSELPDQPTGTRVPTSHLSPPAPEVAELADAPPTFEEEQCERLWRWLARGASDANIVRLARRPWANGGLGVGMARTKTLLRKVRGDLQRDFETRKATAKAEQSERLRELLVRLSENAVDVPRRQVGKDGKVTVTYVRQTRVPWSSIVRTEELLADVEGTRDPIRVEHDVRLRASIMGVIANLTPERMEQLLERAQARKAALPASGQP